MKICNKCNKERSLSNFHKDSEKKSGYRDICKLCKKEESLQYRLINRDKINKAKKSHRLNNSKKCYLMSYKSKLKHKYGIIITQRDQLITDQNNKCAICKHDFVKTPNVDHNHITNKVRGLLCNPCNQMIGLAKENINTLNNAINYLKKI